MDDFLKRLLALEGEPIPHTHTRDCWQAGVCHDLHERADALQRELLTTAPLRLTTLNMGTYNRIMDQADARAEQYRRCAPSGG